MDLEWDIFSVIIIILDDSDHHTRSRAIPVKQRRRFSVDLRCVVVGCF